MKVKKVVFLILAFAMLVCGLLTVSACDDTSDDSSAQTYTLTFNYDGATGNCDTATKTVIYDQKIGELPQPTKTDYEFNGWKIDGNSVSAETVWKFTENKTAVASWGTQQLSDTSQTSGSAYATGLDYTLSGDGTYYIVSGRGTEARNQFIIPSEYNGKPVKKIKFNAFECCSTIKSITIPASITEIESYAFRRCASLTSVTIENGLTSIGVGAFRDCVNLESVTIPDSVTSILSQAFEGCTSLTNVTVGNGVKSLGNYVFYDCNDLRFNEYENAYYLGNQNNPYSVLVKAKSTDVTTCAVNENCKAVCGGAFKDCTSLTKINYTGTIDQWVQIGFGSNTSNPLYYAKNLYINDELVTQANITTVTEIKDYAFYNCSSLTSITIPDSVTNIGENVFSGCTYLANVTIGNGVTSIGNSAFSGCIGLTKANYTGTIDQWVQIVFSSSYSNPLYYANNLYINDELVTQANITTATEIKDYAFYNCTSLTNITIPDTIPDDVTSIGSSAFSNCYKLVEVINKSKLEIKKDKTENGYVVKYALNVKTEGASEVVNQNGYLFYTYDDTNYLLGYIGNDTELTLPNDYNGKSYEIYKYAFHNCTSLTSVTIPSSVTSIGNSVFVGCTGLASISVAEENEKYKSIDGNLYNKDATTLIQYAIGKTATEFTVPDSVINIGDQAFYGCTSLTSVTIPSSVTSIGNSVFVGCTGLASISVAEENEKYKSIDGNLYNKDATTLIQYAIGKTATEFTVPDSVINIGDQAFYGCTSLTSVTIPSSVASVSKEAFFGCISLTEVYYKRTATDWCRISISSNNDILTTAKRYYYSESVPTIPGKFWHYVDDVPTAWQPQA